MSNAPRLPSGVIVRAWRATDSIADLTELLHRAYADLAARGLRYVATHQDEETTARRISGAECWVAELDSRLVATVTYRDTTRTRGCPWYERPDVASFSQLCVDPSLRRQGIAAALLDTVERRARETGAGEVACDTAEQAEHLIEMYETRGYRVVARADWRPLTNYESVVLSKQVSPATGAARTGGDGSN